MPGKCHFQKSWKDQKDFKDWLDEGPMPLEARCQICKTSFKLGTMGIGALKSHMGLNRKSTKPTRHEVNMKLHKQTPPLEFFQASTSSKVPTCIVLIFVSYLSYKARCIASHGGMVRLLGGLGWWGFSSPCCLAFPGVGPEYGEAHALFFFKPEVVFFCTFCSFWPPSGYFFEFFSSWWFGWVGRLPFPPTVPLRVWFPVSFFSSLRLEFCTFSILTVVFLTVSILCATHPRYGI